MRKKAAEGGKKKRERKEYQIIKYPEEQKFGAQIAFWGRIIPGDDAQDGAILILGVIRVLSDKRLFGNAALATRR